jgi:AhpD family alkylhydroperoxidase
MKSRINPMKVAPEVYKAMFALDAAVKATGLDTSLQHLIKLRASQINGCAYCIDMHSQEARAAGETEQRIYLLDAWREAPFYSDRERAALAWTEAVTLISEGHAPDEVYEQAREQFSEDELTKLTLAIVSINGWNRFAISFRAVPGQHQATRSHAMATAGT